MTYIYSKPILDDALQLFRSVVVLFVAALRIQPDVGLVELAFFVLVLG